MQYTDNPFFSVIIPTYNRARFVATAIESVLGQTYSDWELIVVDDGSTDNTKEITENYFDSRIKYIYQENAERSAARNNGIRNASGRFICFLDSDDYYLNNHLQILHEAVENNPQISVFISGAYEEKCGARRVINTEYPPDTKNIVKFYFDATILTPNVMCVERSLLLRNTFLEMFKKSYWEDTHLWLRLFAENALVHTGEITTVQVEHENRSIAVINKLSIERVEDHVKMIRHLRDHYKHTVGNYISRNDYKKYINRKYHMFIYIARCNHQFGIAFRLAIKSFLNGIYLNSLTVIIKLPVHFLLYILSKNKSK